MGLAMKLAMPVMMPLPLPRLHFRLPCERTIVHEGLCVEKSACGSAHPPTAAAVFGLQHSVQTSFITMDSGIITLLPTVANDIACHVWQYQAIYIESDTLAILHHESLLY
jgi:hypothetical protein